jgi:mono/diheme cytochrome c family protein
MLVKFEWLKNCISPLSLKHNIMKTIKNKRIVSILSLGIIITVVVSGFKIAQSGEWIAPKSADKVINPIKGISDGTKAGKKLYVKYCVICHGAKGKGDGIAGAALNPKPANFIKEKFQNQTDGAIHWKLNEGRAPMASYKTIFNDEQRWQLVNYMRTFKKTPK